MDSSPDNIDPLEALLRLKRYEKPPPRFFNDFSSRVISRIEAGESRNTWWERFGFDLRPAIAAAAGMVACGLVVYSVATADDRSIPSASFLTAGNESSVMSPADPSMEIVLPQVSLGGGNSTNPVAGTGTMDRNGFGGANLIRASFPAQ